MKIKVSNNITIQEPTQQIKQYCNDNLVLSNPDYYKLERLGKWTGGTPKEIRLYEIQGDTYILPFGCLQDVWNICNNKTLYEVNFKPLERLEYESNINLYDYQKNAVQAVLKAKNGVLVMPCGAGKGLPLSAKIYTPNGYILNGDLKIGDKIIGSNGKDTTVTNIYDRGLVDAYKITFSDETEIICDKDHLWTVQKQSQRHDNGKWWTESTENIYNHYKNIKRQDLYYIPVVKPVKFRAKKIPLNPWLLGFLIGDGCFQKTALSFSNSEEDLINKVKSLIFDKFEKKKGKNYDYLIYDNGNINAILKTLGLHNHRSYEKFIPEIYKYNSISVRLAVLQGLFDADGYIAGRGMFEYSTSSKQLANDFVEIVQSLGGTAKLHIKQPTYTYKGEKKVGRISYRVFFKLYDFKPFTSKKHNSKFVKRTKYNKPYRIIKKIEPCEPIQSRCIAVDAKDKLYVTDNFIVTHNTQCGLEIISRLGGRALWLTHTQELLHQSMQRAKSTLNCDKSCYGTITAGKVDIGSHITFATVQTMCKIDLLKYKNVWDIIITDECQHCCGSPTRVTQFYKVLSTLSARYKIGLTATPKRNDGLERSMFALLGGIIHTVDKSAVEEKTCKIVVKTVETGYTPDMDAVLGGDGTLDYMALINDLIGNEDRFEKVLEVIESLDGSAIVLANRVAYLQRLNDEYSGRSVCLSGAGYTKEAKEKRKTALDDLRCGNIDVIFATWQLAAEGLDIQNLRYVVFATPEKNAVVVTQAAGRVGRKADGKEYGTVIDFVDDFSMYKKWYKTRLGYYKKIDAEVIK